MDDLYKSQLGHILIAQGNITPQQLDEALELHKRTHEKLGKILVDLDLVSEETVTEARAIQLDVAYVNLMDNKCDPEMASIINGNLAWNYKCIPVKKVEEKLIVAFANPLDLEAIDMVQLETKLRLEPALATEWRIMEAVEHHYGTYGSIDMKSSLQEAAGELELSYSDESEDEDSPDIEEVKKLGHRAPIVRMVDSLLTQAISKKASDIHIEPRKNVIEIRFRLDGDLQVIERIPKNLHPAVVSRIKIMSELDIAERRMPQDGRISVKINGVNVDIRVSTSPTIFGERLVLRILDRSDGLIPLDNLGFTADELRIFESLISHNQGIVLVTGPTGSGKTTTLYAALNSLKSEQTNIMTVEDPVEFVLDGVNQTNVHHKIGLDFANQLRSILRQDPDIVLVGEIRDKETADVAFRGSLTGHLVLSTLHCNDAPNAITRLLDMELEPFLVSSAINGIVAQRLIKLLCPMCKEMDEPDFTQKLLLGLQDNDNCNIYKAVGCDNCEGTGYKGRTAIREIMVMNSEIRNLTLAKESGDTIREVAIRQGMRTLRDDAVSRVLQGHTTVEEIQRKILIETEYYGAVTQLKAA